jgi:hypothetical protein
MRTTEIKCDQCGSDLTYASNSVDYRVVLGSEGKVPWYVGEGLSGGAMTDMAIPDPFPHTRHFCNPTCLAVWVAHDFPDAQAAYEKQQKHRAWLAEKMATPNPK